MNNLPSLFKHWSKEKTSPIIQLQNKDRMVIAALYLNKINFEDIILCPTNGLSEKYYIYVNGVAVFFTYYKKITEDEITNVKI